MKPMTDFEKHPKFLRIRINSDGRDFLKEQKNDNGVFQNQRIAWSNSPTNNTMDNQTLSAPI